MPEIARTIGSAFKTVSCAADPDDLRPVLDILAAEMVARTARGPLVVLMGEDHTVPAHKVMRQGLMSRLLKTTSSFAYGMERAYDLLPHLLEKKFDLVLDADQRAQLIGDDYNGHRLARAFRATLTPEHSPFTSKNLLAFCLYNNVSIRANDAAKIRVDNKWVLDLPDHQNIPVESLEGVALRNSVIVERALTHMHESGVHIYVQDCGMGHVLGHQSTQGIWPHSESLSALFLQAGVDVLPVYTADFVYAPDKLPEGAAALLRDKGIVVEGLNTRRFMTGMSAPYMEKQMVEGFSAHSGGEIAVFPETTQEEDVREKERLRRNIKQWLKL